MNGFSANTQTLNGLFIVNCDEVDVNKLNDFAGNVITNGTIQTKAVKEDLKKYWPKYEKGSSGIFQTSSEK